MKKYRSYIAIAIMALLATFAYQALKKKDTKSTLDPKETEFAVRDTASLTRIFISEKSGKTNQFDRQPGQPWIINNKYEADPGRMRVLLETVYGLEVKRNVTKSEYNSVIQDLSAFGIKVEIYQNNSLTKTYYIGNEDNTSSGSYGILSDSDNPYLLHLPSLLGIINTRFFVEESEWRSKKLFSSYINDIKRVSVTYPGNPKESFTIENDGTKFTVRELDKIDTLKLSTYLGFFQKVYGESLPTYLEQGYKDSVYQVQPSAIISLEDVNPEKSNTVTCWLTDDTGAMLGRDQKINDMMRLQFVVFDPITVSRSHFRTVNNRE